MQRPFLHIVRAAALAVFTIFALAAPLLPADAHKGATGVVKQRMDAMKDMQKAMKALNAMLSGKQAMDRTAAIGLAETIRDQSGVHMAELFPDGSLNHPSEALPKVWENWSDFRAEADELEREADALARSLTDGDASAQFKRVAASCKSCHKAYRKPK